MTLREVRVCELTSIRDPNILFYIVDIQAMFFVFDCHDFILKDIHIVDGMESFPIYSLSLLIFQLLIQVDPSHLNISFHSTNSKMNFRFFICLCLGTLLQGTLSGGVPQNFTQGDGLVSEGRGLKSVVHRSKRGRSKGGKSKGGKIPCAKRDVTCWCEMVQKYTNEVRKQYNVKTKLKLGPQKQMDQATWYATKLHKTGRFVHQSLPDVTKQVGCKRWVGGENLAYSHEIGDIARRVVDQWVNSKSHKANLVKGWFEEVVTGFYFDDKGGVYSVQTFSLVWPNGTFGKEGDANCQRVGSK